MSTRSQTDSRNSDEHDMSRMSTLTDFEEAIIQQSAQSQAKEELVDYINTLYKENRFRWSDVDELIRMTLQLARIADNKEELAAL